MLRRYQAQFGLKNCPIVLVHSALAAASALLLSLGPSAVHPDLDQRLKFPLKSLDECSDTHAFAGEARSRLQRSVEKNSNGLMLSQPHQHEMPPALDQPMYDQLRAQAQAHASSIWTDWEFNGALQLVNPEDFDPSGTFCGHGMSPLDIMFDPSGFSVNESLQTDPWLEDLERNCTM